MAKPSVVIKRTVNAACLMCLTAQIGTLTVGGKTRASIGAINSELS